MKNLSMDLKHFTAVESATFTFASGINVLIGENGAGKSHVMKLLYSVLKVAQGQPETFAEAQERLSEKLAAVFKPEDDRLEHLVRGQAGAGCEVWVRGAAGDTFFTLSEHGNVALTSHDWKPTLDCIFLPTRDVLAMYEGFIAAYQSETLSFDETYYDVCLALDRGKARGEAKIAADELLSKLEGVLGGGRVSKGANRFYVEFGALKLEAHLVAEGLRKFALLSHLISNASIKSGSILFWDEPESNLNPRLIARLPDILLALAEAGVQIFVATHDYLLAHKLSLAFEYGAVPKGVEGRFHALYRSSLSEPVQVEAGATLAELQHNVILQEYAALHDWEERLLLKELASSDEENPS
ncbi:MAG: AAA family ATPase [Myxococcaceae bacterium]|nr:AAA family ATPase [Myxococcaceae bacterium]